MRISRHDYFMKLAKITSERGTCPRKQVGAVAVKNNRIIMSGYNGSISGDKHCEDIGCLIHDNHCIRTVHAEQNIICKCAEDGISLKNAIIYCTLEPCYLCLMSMASAGISRVIFDEPKIDSRSGRNLYRLIKVYQYNPLWNNWLVKDQLKRIRRGLNE